MIQSRKMRYYLIGEWAFYEEHRQHSKDHAIGRRLARCREKRQARREIQEAA